VPLFCYIQKIQLSVLTVALFFITTIAFTQDKTTLSIKLRPQQKEGIFHSSDKSVVYNIKLKNEVKDIQRGNYLFDVRNDSNRSIFNDKGGFAINQGGSFEREVTIDKLKLLPGCYEISLAAQTFYYKDTVKNFFCYDPEIVAFDDATKPTDFTAYWEEALRNLKNTNPNYTITRRNDMADKYADVFMIEFVSVDNVTIRGWLTIPKAKGKFPVVYKLGDLAETAFPDKSKDKAVFAIDVRGTGMSADDLQLTANEYLLKNANNKNRFIGKGVYLDCLRGLDFIYKHADLKLDTNKVVVMGIGQGAAMAVATVALSNKQPKGLELMTPVNFDIFNLLATADLKNNFDFWPVNVVKDFVSNEKNYTSRDAFERTWSYFDPVNFAPLIHCKFLLGANLKNTACPPKCIYHFLNKLGIGRRDVYVCGDCNNNELNYAFKLIEQAWYRDVF
jgi:cephalosporin-C deacetylase